MILLEVVATRSELDQAAVAEPGGEPYGEWTRDEGARIADEEQLRIARGTQCGVGSLQGCVHVGGLACDRQLVRQRPDRSSRLRCRERGAVDGELVVAQLPNRRAREDALHEHVLLLDQPLADAGRSERFEHLSSLSRLVEVVPARERADELHEGQAANGRGPSGRQLEGEGRAPVLRDEVGRLDSGSVDERVQVARMVGEAVPDVGLSRLTEADQVGSDAPGDVCDVGDDVPPDVGRGGVAVQEQNDGSVRLAGFPVGNRRAENLVASESRVGECCHGSSLKTVWKAMSLKRSSGAAERSTFIRRIAPSHEASRKSANSSAENAEAISPAAWPSAMQAAKGARHSSKMAVRRSRRGSLCPGVSRLKSPIRQPRVNPSPASCSVMRSRYRLNRSRAGTLRSSSASWTRRWTCSK